MTSKERVQATLNHKQPDRVVIDFGATAVTGIHVLAVQKLREFYGLEKKPVKVIEPYQMLGEIEDDLKKILQVDIIDISPKCNMFGIPMDNWKEWKTHWGQVVLVPGNFNTSTDDEGATYIYPEGDTSVAPGAKMPPESYFFDAIVRQQPFDENTLKVEDNLEEFGVWSDTDIQYWTGLFEKTKNTDKAIIGNFGGMGLGDIALVPAMNLKNPKGIRDIAEWYTSSMIRPDFVKELFERQTDIALKNLEKAYQIVGNAIDAVFICGTDFGTQDSTFCSTETYDEIWKPYYQKMNNWIHQHTTWKSFKHCCGSVITLMENFIDSGFDIINPVQINAAGMDPKLLKEKYGTRLTFWGGGIDTQKVLPFGSPGEVEKMVLENCEIFGKDGGFVFNTVHNIQANTPIENMVAMINALNKFNGVNE
jgi:hypothetical protein